MADTLASYEDSFYVVDFLLHVGAEIQGKFDFFFLATYRNWTNLIRGLSEDAKAICIFWNYFPFIDFLIEEGTVLINS